MQQQPDLASPVTGGLTASAPAIGGGSTTPTGMPGRRPYLYVGQLSPQVNDMTLKEAFGSVGPVLSTKVVVDRNMQHPNGLNYGFVEYADVRSAEMAIKSLNGRQLYEAEIKVDWAASSLNHGVEANGTAGAGIMGKENTSNHFHVFVGDLAPEINDSMLRQAFSTFATLSEARVMWDISSGKSRGYGFVAFRDKSDAEQAIATMNGEWLGSRAIRVNWANQKGGGNAAQMVGNPHAAALAGQNLLQGPNRSAAVAAALGGMGALGLGASSMPPTGGAASGTPITYDQALAGSAPHNTTVYVGNIAPFATQNDLIPLFSQYGYIVEIRMQADRGFAFVKLDSHENAASAIVNLAGQIACGRPIKCGWGKDRNESAMMNALRQGMQLSAYGGIAPPQALYGMPQYGFPGGFAYASAAAPGQNSQLAPPVDAAALQQMQAVQAQVAQAHAQALQQQQQQQQQHQQQQQQQQQHQHQQQHQQQQHFSQSQQQQHMALQQGIPGFPPQAS